MLSRLRYSLSARLLLLFIATAVVLLLVVGSIAGKGMSQHFRHSIRPFVVHYVELLEQELGMPPTLERARQITREIPVDIHVFGPDGDWTTATTLLDRDRADDVIRDHRHGSAGKLRRLRVQRFDDDFVLRSRSGPYTVYYQVHDRPARHRAGPYGIILVIALLGIVIAVYLLTRRLFRPVEDIQRGVRAIGEGDLDHRIDIDRKDELGSLADSINEMADQISQMLESKRQLLLAISHELRSPLTRSRVNLALLEDSMARDEITKDIDAMEQLVTELLESERLNSKHASLQLEPCELDVLVTEVVETGFPGAGIDTRLVSVTADVDPARFRLLVRNLLDNAVTHNGEQAPAPQISLSQGPDSFVLEVRDHGQGIGAAEIPHLTEPFYRADPSRQRKTGGYGLGLYLCRMIVEAHGGTLEITSKIGNGTLVCCQFPG